MLFLIIKNQVKNKDIGNDKIKRDKKLRKIS